MTRKLKERKNKISTIALVSLLVSLIFCAFIISATIIDKTDLTKLGLEQLIYESTHRINDAVLKLLYKAHSISALIAYDGGSSFDIVAPTIVDDPSIRNILIAPDGIVAKVYPLAGNESVIGLNFFADGAGNREAAIALDIGDLVLGGPFETVQGGQALVGRMPVYIDTPDETDYFWGLVSVTLNFPQVLDNAELNVIETLGYSYELWRINPDDDQRQVIASSLTAVKPNLRYIEKSMHILNAEWNLRISPVRAWYNYPENIVLIIAGLCISLMIFFVMQNNYELKNMQSVFEQMAISDPLTGIFNRRHFLEIARIGIEKSRRQSEDCYFIMFDIDKFKLVNDTYGHQVGDKVLMDVTARIKADIRPYDLFARYGGEEFIIFAAGLKKEKVIEMTNRLRISLCERKYEYENIIIESSASFGIAQLTDYNLDKAIKHSDEALYTAKRNGRNCVVFYEEESGA